MRLGIPVVTGGLDKAVVRRYVQRQLRRVIDCYEKELVTDPDLEGTVVVDVQLDEGGQVLAASANGVSETVSGCIARAMGSMVYPAPRDGSATMRYRLTFSSGQRP